MSDHFGAAPWHMDADCVADYPPLRHTLRMAMTFHGKLQELQDRLLTLDLDGDWQPQPTQVWKFRCRDRAGMLWAETTGRIWFDCPQMPRAALETKIEAVLADGAITQPAA